MEHAARRNDRTDRAVPMKRVARTQAQHDLVPFPLYLILFPWIYISLFKIFSLFVCFLFFRLCAAIPVSALDNSHRWRF